MGLMKGRKTGLFILSEQRHASYAQVETKTANYTVTYDDIGKTLVMAANANGTFTLPTPKDGAHYRFFNKVNQNMYVLATNTQIISFNNTGCNNAAIATSNEKTGACIEVSSDGTNWFLVSLGKHTLTLS